jgi:hypothetical protein
MPFWKWWTSIVVLILSLGYVQYELDILGFVYENDPTKITMIIAAIFLLATLRIGFLSWKSQFGDPDIYAEKAPQDLLWFSSDVVMSIGMVGTLIDIDTTSAAAMKEVIGTLASGMGIALMTSLMGLITSIILKLQLVLMENSNEEI